MTTEALVSIATHVRRQFPSLTVEEQVDAILYEGNQRNKNGTRNYRKADALAAIAAAHGAPA